jgi:hypothetical protein
MTDYPEHDKLTAISDRSQAIGEFLDWMSQEKKIIRASWLDAYMVWVPCDEASEYGLIQNDDGEWGWWRHAPERLHMDTTSVQDLLAEFFDIDRAKIEEEKRTMLDRLRTDQAKA